MITVKHIDFCQANRHLTLVNGKESPRLNNQFAMIENGFDAGDAYLEYFIWLQAEIEKPYSTVKRELIKLAKAHKRGKWIEIACFDEYNHADLIAQAIDELSETLDEQPRARAITNCGSMAEPIIGFYDDDDREYSPLPAYLNEGYYEPYDTMFMSDIRAEQEEKEKNQRADMPLEQIVWVIGKTAAMIGFMIDDDHAIVPDYGVVQVNFVRFAKHKLTKLPYIQKALATAYNEHYQPDDCEWSFDTEHIDIDLTEQGSRYLTDLDPSGDHFDHELESGFYIDLCAEDVKAHEVKHVGQKQYGGLVPHEQFDYVKPVFISRDNNMYAVREVRDQLENKFIRRPADQIHMREYRHNFEGKLFGTIQSVNAKRCAGIFEL
ncbi:hypothetical protein KFU94_00890 [Chloroflexi bacterium TSY]|nr:hypothetical protein [Chloroflexi bacterium TSY]